MLAILEERASWGTLVPGTGIGTAEAVSPSIGEIVNFTGTTRDISRDERAANLYFEYYPGMAEKKLAEIRGQTIRKYSLIDVTNIHRVGNPAGVR